MLPPAIESEAVMTSDDRTLILSLIFGAFLIFAGMLFRYIKYGIPFWKSLLELGQEMLKGFKEFRKNFIPVTKKALGAIWRYIKKKLSDIGEHEPVKCNLLNAELEYYLQNAVSDYVFKPFKVEIIGVYTPIPSYAYVSFYTKSAITKDDEAEIVWALEAKFRDYMRLCGCNFPYFSVPYVQGNHIEVYIYYCENGTERQAYQSKINQIMQMRSTSSSLNEVDTYDRDF